MKKKALIGHTGFIGGNLVRQYEFNEFYNSKNIADIGGRDFDLLVCAGVSAVKWWANQHPEEDREKIDALVSHLSSVRARKVYVLSTIDVYPARSQVDESFDCHGHPNHAYGVNRLRFEDAIRTQFENAAIIRLSGVFGQGLRKNVIYDLLHDNCLHAINPDSVFQYYNVAGLWSDIEQLDRAGIRLINFVTQPIRTGDIVDRFFPGKAVGWEAGGAVQYDVRTMYSGEFERVPPYMATADEVMRDLGDYFDSFRGSQVA